MTLDKQFDRLFKNEFPSMAPNTIWRNDAGEYEVFGRYRIVKENTSYRVFCSLTDAGLFHSTRSALSWCIADKFKQYNTARNILNLDNRLHFLTVDINARAAIGDRTKTADQHEIILTKLESKIIEKTKIANRLNDCVNWAKYYQLQGFASELAKKSKK
jgi:hypothetical protein|tara:strand:+ start:250 stop:726 length:477 start_codon:yes stop_codon:yes gene_type:complete